MTVQIAKRRNMFVLFAVAIATVALTLIFTGVASGDNDDKNGKGDRYEVTITNITKGQIISPAVVATHRSSLDPIFTLGSPASDELAQVAEDAILQPLVDKLGDDPAVGSVEVLFGDGPGPILPGATASFEIKAGKRDRNLSLVAMLVSTNDTFMGLNGIALPKGRASDYLSPGYDAGSEVNNEDCAFIPGPPCGNPEVRDTVGAEGYVYIGNGVHGFADLDPALHDWNNPVAKITVRRIRGGDDD